MRVCVCVCVCVAESRSQDGVRRSPGALIGGTFKAATPSPAALSRGTHPQAGAWQVALSQNAGPRPPRRAPSLRRTGAPTPAMEHNRHGFQEHAMPQAHSRQGRATSDTTSRGSGILEHKDEQTARSEHTFGKNQYPEEPN